MDALRYSLRLTLRLMGVLIFFGFFVLYALNKPEPDTGVAIVMGLLGVVAICYSIMAEVSTERI